MREAAWPLIRRDLGLDYVAIGLLISLPDVVGSLVETPLALLGDTGHRRRVILSGGVVFAVGVFAVAGAQNFWFLLAATAVLSPASGAFVSLSQATMMDRAAADRDRAMALWTFAGSIGVVLGPLMLAGALALGAGWRATFAALGVATIPVVLLAARLRFPMPEEERRLRRVARDAFRRLRSRAVVRWLVLVELTDLLGDVLLGFVALYFVDVAGASVVTGATAVTILGMAGLAGDGLLVLLLRRIDGLALLRVTAALMLAAYPAFLLVPGIGAKLVMLGTIGVLRAGWYAIPTARLYDELHDASGTALAIGNVANVAGLTLPFAVGVIAQRAGLQGAMWLLLVAPIALLVWVPRHRAAP